MRVTNSMLVRTFMNNLSTNMSKMDKIQNQLATGRKFAHISDDPTALIYSQAAKNKLHRLSHYQGSIGMAGDWLREVESGVMDLQGVVASMYEACVDAGTDVKTAGDRQNAAETVAQLREHFVDTLNLSFGDKYVFSGYNVIGDGGSGPFTLEDDGSGGKRLLYNGEDVMTALTSGSAMGNDVLAFDIGPGVSIDVSINGLELLEFQTKDAAGNDVKRNIFDVFNEMIGAMQDPTSTTDDVLATIKPLQDAQTHLLSMAAEIGGRTTRLDLLSARYEQDEINYTQMMSDAEDVDFAEVIMNQKMAEAVYQAALSSGAQIIQPTLMDFLR